MTNPYLRRQSKQPIGATGRRSETQVSKRMGGKLTVGSGNKAHSKGDVVVTDQTPYPMRVECKSTTNATLPVDIAWLAKIKAEALARDQYPMVTLSFTHPDGSPREQWAAIPLSLMSDLLAELAEARNQSTGAQT